ncbi:MAG: hypothetical protein IT269_04710, partial [Saprospiraceae bacterium]|nr:hypothetical protein [Saprospiraceae bacterium]
ETENAERWPMTNRIFAAAVLLLPAMNMAGWWPRAFSWHLYDNTQSEVVFFTENARFDEPFQTKIWSKYAYDRQRQLLLDDWAIHELHVPLPDVQQVAENVGQHLCQRIKTGENVGWSVLRVQQFSREQVVTDTIMCHSNQ